MERTPSFKEILNIAIPIMIGSVSESISAVVDTAFMGKLGTLAIDGMGMTNVFLLMLLMIGWSFSRSIQILVSQNYGAKQYESIGEVVYNGFLLLIPISFLIYYVLYFHSDVLLSIIIKNPSILKISHEICQLRAWGFPLIMMTLIINGFYTGIGKTKIIMYSQGVGALSNIILNYVLVFGKLGIPAMGYRGSALATVFSEMIILAILIVCIYFDKQLIKEFFLFHHRKWRTYLVKEISSLAYPMLILHAFSLGSWVYFFSIVEKMGEKELAISMVIKQIFVAITIPGFSLASTSNTLVGQLVGSRKTDLILKTIIKVIKVNYLILLSLALLVFIFKVQVVGLFTTDDVVLQGITPPLIALLIAYLFIPASNVLFMSISALGNTKIPLILESIVLICYLLYLYTTLFVMNGGLVLAWLSEFFYWGCLLTLSIFYFWKFDWKKRIVYLSNE